MYVSELFTRGIYVQFIEGAVLFKASSPKITMYAIKLTVYCKCKCTLICAIKSKAQSSSLHMTDKHNHRFIFLLFFKITLIYVIQIRLKSFQRTKRWAYCTLGQHFHRQIQIGLQDFILCCLSGIFFFSHQSKDFKKKEIVWCTKY